MAIFSILSCRSYGPEHTRFVVRGEGGTIIRGDSFLCFDTHHPLRFTIEHVEQVPDGIVLICTGGGMNWENQFASARVDTSASVRPEASATRPPPDPLGRVGTTHPVYADAMESRWRRFGRAMRLTAGVVSCVVAIGLCISWATSYEVLRSGNLRIGDYYAQPSSGHGVVTLTYFTYLDRKPTPRPTFGWFVNRYEIDDDFAKYIHDHRFDWEFRSRDYISASVPHGVLITIYGIVAFVCLGVPRRFTVRGLLVATTLAAVVCGLIASGV